MVKLPTRQFFWPLAAALLLFALCIVFVDYFAQVEDEKRLARLRQTIGEQASELRVRIEYEVNTTLNLTMGALVYVSANPHLTQEQFSQVARRIIQHAPYIRNIGLAKDNTISHIYPLQGNENALGLNYLENIRQRAAVLHAMKTHSAVIAGPVDLVQGGRGLISRIPIYLDDGNQTYWGMTSVVLDVEAFFENTGLNAAQSSLRLALRGKDAKGDDGAVFFGDESLFDSDENIALSISLPQGSWVLAAAPKSGWDTGSTELRWIWIYGSGIAMIVSALFYGLLVSNAATRRAKSIAEMANEYKSRFFTNMTHELRTPLTTILGVIRLINNGIVSPDSDDGRRLLSSAERNCKRLNWLVNDILDLKKLESGKMEFHASLQPIAPVILESINDVQPYASEYNISIEPSLSAAEGVMLFIDSMRIQQALVNLLSNAVKYSPNDTEISVRLLVTQDHARLEVSDDGPGIADDKLETIFSEFGQAAPSARNATASTGLGLSISRHIVEHHHGTIGCYNRPEGGATFFIELPLPDSR